MSENGRPSAVLFDLDGTLIDTKSLYLEAYRQAVEPYIRKDLTRDDIMALNATSETAFLRAVVSEEDFDACLDDFYGAYHRLHETSFPGIFPGVPELLDSLRAAGVPLGLVTGKSRRSWDITRAVVSVGPFEVLVFDDDVRAPKPDPHGLEIALEAMGAAPEHAWYVGDTLSDAEAARAAGLRPVTVLWSRPEEDRPRMAERVGDTGAVVVERPQELHRVLGLDPRNTASSIR